MNMLLTGLEFMIVRADPLAWVRDMWSSEKYNRTSENL